MKIEPGLHGLEFAALFSCAVLTGVGAVINTARIEQPGALGRGGGPRSGVGLSAFWGETWLGAPGSSPSTSSTRSPPSPGRSGRPTRSTPGPRRRRGDRALSGGGVEFAFDIAGAVPALELAFAVTARGGTTVTAGLPHPDKRMALSPVTLVAEERTLKGSYIGSAAPFATCRA